MNVTAMARREKGMTRDEAVAKARDLAGGLRPFTDEAEAHRRIPKAAVEPMAQSGLLPMVRPCFGAMGRYRKQAQAHDEHGHVHA